MSEFLSLTGKLSNPVIKLQTKEVSPARDDVTVTASAGFDGLSEVIVKGDPDLISSNIRTGTSIFGVPGNLIPLENTSIVKRGSIVLNKRYVYPNVVTVNYDLGWFPDFIMFYRTVMPRSMEEFISATYYRSSGGFLPSTNNVVCSLSNSSDIRILPGNKNVIRSVSLVKFDVIPYSDYDIELTIEPGNYEWIAIKF